MTAQALDLAAARLANDVAEAILEGYLSYRDGFREITRRAGHRFEVRDWAGAVADGAERIDLYTTSMEGLQSRLKEMLGPRAGDRRVWTGAKTVYRTLIAGRPDSEIRETWFNSISRRVFQRVGVDADAEFTGSDFGLPAEVDGAPLVRRYQVAGDATELVRRILSDGWFGAAQLASLEEDARLAGRRLAADVRSRGGEAPITGAEIVRTPFYRRKGAYLIGRLYAGAAWLPLALALVHTPQGVSVDAVLTDEDDISIIFSFAQSHFSVDVEPASRLVRYLRGLLPRKPVADLYIALGEHKHGKTEIYRQLLDHLQASPERFTQTPGIPGMVMIVFAIPGHDMVLKIIRDHFPPAKTLTRSTVKDKYRLVFRHDRAGRLVEAQEFEQLRFDRARFSPELLEELARDADRSVTIDDHFVAIQQAYIERRVTPLDVLVKEAPANVAREAVADFGQAVTELAANNIFPGELLPKNFGVTRHGRVVSYDYDELGFLTDFVFKPLPEADTHDDFMADEAWYGVEPNEVFPEEMNSFLGLPAELSAVLKERHRELYDWRFWTDMQRRVKAGEIVDIYPYRRVLRLRS